MKKDDVECTLYCRGFHQYQIFLNTNGSKNKLIDNFKPKDEVVRLFDITKTDDGRYLIIFSNQFGYEIFKISDDSSGNKIIMSTMLIMSQEAMSGLIKISKDETRITGAHASKSGEFIVEYDNKPTEKYTFPSGSDTGHCNGKPNYSEIKWHK